MPVLPGRLPWGLLLNLLQPGTILHIDILHGWEPLPGLIDGRFLAI